MYEKINQILNIYPNGIIYNKKHPKRTTIQEELNRTIKLNLENIFNAKKFLKLLDLFESKFDLVETGIFIYKNVPEVKEILFNCFNLMKEYGLKRDQNVYNYAFKDSNIIPILLEHNEFF